jgi:hypothetical protein
MTMAKAVARGEVNASADEVWALVGGFGNWEKFDSAVVASSLEEGGVQRRTQIKDSGHLVERLLKFDHEGRVYHYTIAEIVDVPMPINNYYATIRVDEGEPGKTCIFEMSATFDPAPGQTVEAVEELMAADFGAVLGGLQKLFSG